MPKLKHLGAPILSLKEFAKLRPKLKGTIVMTSGAFDPVHPGHISCFIESKKLGDILVVSVNGDWFLRYKKGKQFQDLNTRALIVSGIRGVDYVIPFEIKNDISQAKSLEIVRPHIFAKGGDRFSTARLPQEEVEVLKKYKIDVRFGIGAEKRWSSSDLLAQWVSWNSRDKKMKSRKKEHDAWAYGGWKPKHLI